MRSAARGLATPAGAGLLLALLCLPAAGQEMRTLDVSRSIDGERRFVAEVNYAAGRMRIAPADRGVLYNLQIEYDERHFTPIADYRDGRLTAGIESRDDDEFNIRDEPEGSLELLLPREIPVALSIRAGAVESELDLGGVPLTRLSIETGASRSTLSIAEPNPARMRQAVFQVGAAEFEAYRLGNLNAEEIEVSAGVGDVVLDFTGEWQQDAEVQVSFGLGDVELRLPRGLGVRLSKSSLLTSFDTEDMRRRGGDWYSRDWDSAERRIHIHVNAAFGDVDVRWVR